MASHIIHLTQCSIFFMAVELEAHRFCSAHLGKRAVQRPHSRKWQNGARGSIIAIELWVNIGDYTATRVRENVRVYSIVLLYCYDPSVTGFFIREPGVKYQNKRRLYTTNKCSSYILLRGLITVTIILSRLRYGRSLSFQFLSPDMSIV